MMRDLHHTIGTLEQAADALDRSADPVMDMARMITDAGGEWVAPPPGAPFAVALHDVHAMGATATAAVENWRITARTILGGYAMPDPGPRVREAQIRWADRIIARPQDVLSRTLARACTILIALSPDHTRRERARALKQSIGGGGEC